MSRRHERDDGKVRGTTRRAKRVKGTGNGRGRGGNLNTKWKKKEEK